MLKKTLYISAIPVILFCILLIWREHHLSKTYRPYQKLELGLTYAQVLELFGRQPDYVCQLQGNSIAYYFGGSLGAADPDVATLPSTVNLKEDIPFIYDARQLMFNDADSLVAYTWNGETYTVHTSKGEFEGSCLHDLPDGVLAELGFVHKELAPPLGDGR